MDWITVALIALGALLVIVLLVWVTVFVIMARHVIRFQKQVADEVLGDPHGTPGPDRTTTTRAIRRQKRERGEL